MVRFLAIPVLFLTLAVTPTTARTVTPADTTDPDNAAADSWPWAASPEQMKKYELAARRVFKALLDAGEPAPDMEWPPTLLILDGVQTGNGVDRYNAFASVRRENGEPVRRNGKVVPLVTITRGYLDILNGDEHAVALVLGHELGHHRLGHTTRDGVLKPAAKASMDGHRREADADLFGAKLLLKAGYSLRKAAPAYWRAMERLPGGLYSAAKGTCYTHPATSDRMARLFAQLDRSDEPLWRGMAAFENGVTFLAVKDYASAEWCFERVTREFPTCHEAWANLGQARLLRYCEGLSPADLREIGHFLGLSGYRTSGSLLTTRTDPAKLWLLAVGDLRTADRLRPGQPVVLANLGLAYLVHPAGKAAGVGEAEAFLARALGALEQAAPADPRARAELLVNLGVVQAARGDAAAGRRMLAEAKKLAQTLRGGVPADLSQAIVFNTALLLATGGNLAQAADVFVQYLAATTQSSPWWAVAYEHYRAACRSIGREVKPRDQLVRTALVRRAQLAVALSSGGIVHIGESVEEVVARLGKPARVLKDATGGLRRLRFPNHGIDLMADEDEVFAVVIVSAEVPGLPVQATDTGVPAAGRLKVGMTRQQVEALPGGKNYAERPFSLFKMKFAYYADLGVAVMYDKEGPDGVVVALLVGQLGRPTDDRVD